MRIRIDSTVEKFISSFDKPIIAKVLRTIDLLERFGQDLGMPHSKKISKDMFELRIRGQREIRIFYCFHKNSAYLLYGFIKKSKKTPKKELLNAQIRYKSLTRSTSSGSSAP